jgi:4-deoxy-L-threo-5-hexosulose-uronate ketol-isomerase
MTTNYKIRYAAHPNDVKHYTTQQLRDSFLVDNLFIPDQINLVYSDYDRFIVGGAFPVSKKIVLETVDILKAKYFLERRELGIINIGGEVLISVDGKEIKLGLKEALYIGSGNKEIIFSSVNNSNPAKLYLNSAPAHTSYPVKKITLAEADAMEAGSTESSNKRKINRLIINSIVPSCQLQMGLTEFMPGSVWNTMPVHTHSRRMEAYFYFEIPQTQAVCHFMGETNETRHIWIKNEQAVISPNWSIHSGVGTSQYAFIWGMAGENLDYGDMDVCQTNELK